MQSRNWEMSAFVDKLFKPQLPLNLYHYTTMDVFFNHILKKTGTKANGSDLKLINKYGEDTYYVSLMFPTLRHTNDEKEIKKGIELYNMITGDDINPTPANHFEQDFKNNSYSFSLSEVCDSLAMWTRYGGANAKGVCIEFDTNHLDFIYKDGKKEGSLEKCIYVDDVNLYDGAIVKKKEDFIETLREIWNSNEQSDSNNKMASRHFLSNFCTRMKNADYIDEKEWRMVFAPTSDDNSIKDMQYMVKNNMIVPYILVNLPIESIKRVIIGPNQDSIAVSNSLKLFMLRKHLDICVEPSKISYRM